MYGLCLSDVSRAFAPGPNFALAAGTGMNLAVAADGTVAVTAGGDLVIFTAAQGGYTPSAAISLGGPASGVAWGNDIAFAPNGDVYVALPEAGAIARVERGGATPVASTPITGVANATGVAVTPDGSRVLVASGNSIAFYEVADFTAPPLQIAVSGAQSLAIGPKGDYVLAVGSQREWGMLQAVLVNWRTAGISAIVDLGLFASNSYSVTLQGGLGLFVVPQDTAIVLAFPPMAPP
jgi:DNA-binding beta-propeller fold protein YncE